MNHGWRRLGVFFGLTILLLGLVPILSALTGASMDFGAVGRSATEKTGIEQTSNLVTVIRLCLAEPALWLLVLGSSVPSLAALVVVAASGRTALTRFASRIHPLGRGADWQIALRAYGLIFVVVPLGLMCVYAFRVSLPGPEYARPSSLLGLSLIGALLMAAFLDQGGVLEEFGWRGYGQSELQHRLMSPLQAAIIVGVAWGLWHVPRDVFAGVIGRLGPLQYVGLYLPAFCAGTIASSILAAYFMNRCGGSVLPAIMVHGLVNDAVGLSGKVDIERALTPFHQITSAGPFLAIAMLIVARSGRELGRERAVASEEP